MNPLLQQIQTKLEDVSQHYRPVSSERTLAAVLVPFFEKNGELHLLFTKRTTHLQHHSGEICFPGGSRERADPDLLSTALRELYEEIAVPKDKVEVLGRLDEIETVSSSFLVVPYIGSLKPETNFTPNKAEVESILEIPFQHFRNPAISWEESRIVDQKNIPVYYYQWESHTIWGLTARILKKLLDLAP
jgi:8-oxo-dGTP pyrophosphatase MutT (NUDIX family)